MKKTLLTMALATATVAAFAQGRISMQTDSGALVTLAAQAGSPASDNSGRTLVPLAADNGVAGQPVATSGPLPSGVSLDVGLYGGTASGSLSLLTTVLLNPNAGAPQNGQYPSTKITLPWAGGTISYFDVRVWDSSYASYTLALVANAYTGEDNIFSMTPSTSAIASPGINNGGNTTWGAAGNEVPLIVGVTSIPEPATFALAGLGAAAMVIFRRRK